jgi:2-polyprenyl-3-methyl-5-hydroxy-6-metoxy-1,4-benzoquinol methylase
MKSEKISNKYSRIHELKKKYPIFLSAKIMKGLNYDCAAKFIKKNDKVLDVGSNTQELYATLKRKKFSGTYKSMDIDTSVKADYYSLKSIKEKFDCIVMLEVIEHMNRKTFDEYLSYFRTHLLKKGGTLIISTPNIGNVYCVHNDSTHVTFYPIQELCAILDVNGYSSIQPFRLYHIYKFKNPFKTLFIRLIQILRHPFTYFFDIDFNCPQIMVVCKNEKA